MLLKDNVLKALDDLYREQVMSKCSTKEECKNLRLGVLKAICVVKELQTVDAVEVVHCEDCEYYSRSGFCRNGNITSNCDCDLEKEPICGREKVEWISVKDRLPEIQGEDNNAKFTDVVLAYCCNCVLMGYFKIYKWDESWIFYGVGDDSLDEPEINKYITHWMPLPPSPEGE